MASDGHGSCIRGRPAISQNLIFTPAKYTRPLS
jgi:hypothetical protein